MELYLDRLTLGRSELELAQPLSLKPANEAGPGDDDLARLDGTLFVDDMDHKILVHGEFEVQRMMDCHRCGEPTQQRYTAELEIMILRRAESGPDHFRSEQEPVEDSWVIYAPRGVVDLRDAIREAIFLDEPILIRCGDDCSFKEGDPRQDAEDTADAGSEEHIDPRWDKLRQLRDADKGDADTDGD